ncbi:MAG: DUF2975 domain-containing protein [Bacillota bacterium]|nr:DUF2975 domain-containing protein [Bacillota bacterium]MDW7683251.1 DUF2975 domain-containing protein [Bacillota bacterium]
MEKKRRSLLKVTSVFINIAVVGFIMMFIGSLLTAIFNPEDANVGRVWFYVTALSVILLILFILYMLKLIVRTVSENNPFVERNIHRFRLIGYATFMIGLLDAIANFPGHSGMDFFAVPSGSIKAATLLYIVVGFLALLMAEIFAAAREIKLENDMTV